MPRTLPWLTEPSAKKAAPRKAQSERKRSSSPGDLVNSDLEPIGSSSPQRRSRTRDTHREPSSSPPTSVKVAPTVEYMREGFTMDDRYMMVEDEFTTTARLFSLPLHQDEYERTRRRAKARGTDTLKLIGHGTDGNAGSRALRLRMEAEERAKKRKAVAADDSDDEEEEYMADPQLAGLMTASQSTPRKSLRGFASNSQRTPRIAGGRTRDVVGAERVYRRADISAIEADVETEDEDEDDLDVLAPKTRPTASASTKHRGKAIEERTTPEPVKKSGVFKQFTNSVQAEREPKRSQRPRTRSRSRSFTHRNDDKPPAVREPCPLSIASHNENDTEPQPKPIKMSRTAAILAKRREAEKKAKEDGISPEKQIKQELQSQVRTKEELASQTQGRQIKREPCPSPVRQALASKSMAQRRAARAKQQAEEKQRSKIDDIPTFLY